VAPPSRRHVGRAVHRFKGFLLLSERRAWSAETQAGRPRQPETPRCSPRYLSDTVKLAQASAVNASVPP